MRILITGACGFVGSTLARGLREGWPDWEIVGVDNFVRPGSEMNRSSLRACGVKIGHADIRVPSDLEGLPRCDWIVDAAAEPSVLAGLDVGKGGSRQLIEHNLIGTVHLLELAKSWHSGFVMFSSSRVYSLRVLTALPVEVEGERFIPRPGGELPMGLSRQGVAESFSTEPPLSLYGSSKRAAELLACEYGEAFDFPVLINRCGVLAGAGQFGKVDQGIFSYWIHACAQKRPLRYIGFNGTGYQVRDCLHARDLLPLITAQINDAGAAPSRILNISGGMSHSASLRELSAWCTERFGTQDIGREKGARPYDVPWLVLDSSEAARVWNWQPITSLHAIWSEIADHAQQHPHWLNEVQDTLH
jgi:CDP-paratose 2-epimerase